MKTITTAELRDFMTDDPALIILDVRSPMEFSEVHIEGTINIPLDELNPGQVYQPGRLHENQLVYLLCRTGSRASKAAERFAREGFTRTIVVQGGILAWVESGYPVKRGTVKVISLERQVRVAAGSLVLTGLLLSWFVHPGFVGLSAFVGAGLVFAGLTDFCGMGLLLAKLPCNKRRSVEQPSR